MSEDRIGTTQEVMTVASKVKKAAILKQVQEDYGAGPTVGRDFESYDMSSAPAVAVHNAGQNPDVAGHDPARAGYDIRTPGGWESFKSSFDWIESKFESYLDHGEAKDREQVTSKLAEARKTLEDFGLQIDNGNRSSDPFLGYKERIVAIGNVSDTFNLDGWDGKAMNAFSNYISRFSDRESNIILVMTALWHAANAERVIVGMKYARLVAIGNAAIAKMTATDNSSGGYNPNAKLTYSIGAAIVGVASAAVSSTGVGIPVGLALASGAFGVGGLAFGDTNTTSKSKGDSHTSTINVSGNELNPRDIQLDGGTCQEILQSMWDHMGEMETEVETAVGTVTRQLKFTHRQATTPRSVEVGPNSLPMGKPLVGERPELSKAGKSGDVKPLLN